MTDWDKINKEFDDFLGKFNDKELQEWFNNHLMQRVRRSKDISTKCVNCSKQLSVGVYAHENAENRFRNAEIYDGTVVVHTVGYGSDFDNSKLVIAICDNCIKEKLDNGLIIDLNPF